ncbi:MAG: hypothetical protein ACK55I_32465, partial [bacterium]
TEHRQHRPRGPETTGLKRGGRGGPQPGGLGGDLGVEGEGRAGQAATGWRAVAAVGVSSPVGDQWCWCSALRTP